MYDMRRGCGYESLVDVNKLGDRRYFIEISYKGSNYFGWQIQPNNLSVQEILEGCLSKIFNQKINIVGSGRTDTGVHAVQQFAHFDIDKTFDCSKLIFSLNSLLPDDIVVKSIFEVPSTMHARFSVITRTYKYVIFSQKNPFSNEMAYFFDKALDIGLMNLAAKMLCDGAKDYKIFCKTRSDCKNYFCDIQYAKWEKISDGIVFYITANRFLRGMVRIIVAHLIKVGEKKIALNTLYKVIHGEVKINRPPLVPGHGLFLERVCYK